MPIVPGGNCAIMASSLSRGTADSNKDNGLLGEIGHGLPLSSELTRFRTSHRGTLLPVAASRLDSGRGSPFHSLGISGDAMAEGSSIWDVLNSLAAVSAMFVSIYALHHSRRVDKRLSAEPYFRHKWRSVHAQFAASLKTLETWLSDYERWSPTSKDGLDQLPELTPAVHKEIDWGYQPEARLPFEQLAGVVGRLAPTVANLNKLRYITSDSRRLVLGLVGIGASDHQDSEELKAYVHEVCKRCLGKTDATIGELRENPNYTALVEREIRAVSEDVARLKTLLVIVGKTVDHFGAKFDAQ